MSYIPTSSSATSGTYYPPGITYPTPPTTTGSTAWSTVLTSSVTDLAASQGLQMTATTSTSTSDNTRYIAINSSWKEIYFGVEIHPNMMEANLGPVMGYGNLANTKGAGITFFGSRWYDSTALAGVVTTGGNFLTMDSTVAWMRFSRPTGNNTGSVTWYAARSQTWAPIWTRALPDAYVGNVALDIAWFGIRGLNNGWGLLPAARFYHFSYTT